MTGEKNCYALADYDSECTGVNNQGDCTSCNTSLAFTLTTSNNCILRSGFDTYCTEIVPDDTIADKYNCSQCNEAVTAAFILTTNNRCFARTDYDILCSTISDTGDECSLCSSESFPLTSTFKCIAKDHFGSDCTSVNDEGS